MSAFAKGLDFCVDDGPGGEVSLAEEGFGGARGAGGVGAGVVEDGVGVRFEDVDEGLGLCGGCVFGLGV